MIIFNSRSKLPKLLYGYRILKFFGDNIVTTVFGGWNWC